MTWLSKDNQRILDIYRILEARYPGTFSGLLEPKRGNPVDVLVATILSQATNDVLSDRAFAELKKLFPTWEDVLRADPQAVEEALSVGGLQHEKTKKVRATLRKIKDDFGSISLDPLIPRTTSEAFDYLVSLPGVGPKTAACVLAFGLGKPAFPVDTHVLRLSRRLGIVPMKMSAEKTQKLLEDLIPDEMKMPLHVLMIRHGRTTCSSQRPRCSVCPLAEVCEGDPSAKKNLS